MTLQRRYGLLLVLLIISYLLSAFITSRWISDLQLVLFTLAGLVEIRNAPLRRRTARLVIAAGFLVSLLMIIIADHLGGDAGRGAASVWKGVLLLVIAGTIVRQVLLARNVTLQNIYGAISAYLIIGLMFAAFYAAMYYLNGRVFFFGHQRGTTSNFQYFSFTTLTTLGYGDFTAASNGGRAVAMIEAMSGQIFLVTLVAKLVSSFRPATPGGSAGGGTAPG
jgi:ion channel